MIVLPLRVGEDAFGVFVVQARPYQGNPRMTCCGSATATRSAIVVEMSKWATGSTSGLMDAAVAAP